MFADLYLPLILHLYLWHIKIHMKYFKITAIVGLSLLSCSSNGQTPTSVKVQTHNKVAKNSRPNTLAQQFNNPSVQQKQQVIDIYNQLTDEERAAQMIMIASSETLGFPYASHVKQKIDKGVAGNVIFLKGTTTNFKKQETYLSNSITKGLLPIFGCDCEPSLFHYKFTDKKRMLPTSKLQDSLKIVQSLDTINRVMEDLHININFAPVVDMAVNKEIISNRSMSTDPKKLVYLNSIFVNHEQNNNIAATIKHFPGHGAVTGDTHHNKVWINGKMTELENFRNVIKKSDPLLVMIGHISIKNNPEGYNTENGIPSSISRKIVTDLLKKDIGFTGIATTDALNMGAVKNIPNADFEAVKAGIDLVLMPNNPEKLHAQLTAALKANDALAKQIETSVKKIILLKVITGRVK